MDNPPDQPNEDHGLIPEAKKSLPQRIPSILTQEEVINTKSNNIQIDEARQRIHRNHPLSNLPIERVLPGIGRILKMCCCFKT